MPLITGDEIVNNYLRLRKHRRVNIGMVTFLVLFAILLVGATGSALGVIPMACSTLYLSFQIWKITALMRWIRSHPQLGLAIKAAGLE